MDRNINNKIEIFGLNVERLNYGNLLYIIYSAIKNKQKIKIAYANTNTLNKIYVDSNLRKIFKSFDYIHPDGIGIFLASKILYGKQGLEFRITGSDFYPFLVNKAIKENWKIFFFGHTEEVLQKVRSENISLKITGTFTGYDYDNRRVIENINLASPDILIVGLGCPLQETWIYENFDKINSKVILAVGDGIKVFADVKYRGPKFFRKIGFEWFFRFLSDPLKNFNKSVIGNMIFVFRILAYKFKSKKP